MTKAPAELYKFLTFERAEQVIRTLRIRFSQVSVLNDVEEFRPPYKGVGSGQQTLETIRQRFREKHPDRVKDLYSRLPRETAEEIIDEVMAKGAAVAEANFEQSVQAIYDKLDQNFGLLSLSANPTSTLMWSFYSDGGRGVAIEFDTEHFWFNAKRSIDDAFRHLRPVLYVADRKPTYILATTDDDVLYTKLEEWRFESEWRIIRNFNDAAIKVGPDQYGKDILLFNIPEDAIKAVVFGYRISEAHEKHLLTSIQSHGKLKHVLFKRVVREMNGHLRIEIVSPVCTGQNGRAALVR